MQFQLERDLFIDTYSRHATGTSLTNYSRILSKLISSNVDWDERLMKFIKCGPVSKREIILPNTTLASAIMTCIKLELIGFKYKIIKS